MTRLRRFYYQNAVYHVNFRGNNKQTVLGTNPDKIDLLISVGKLQQRRNFKVYGFVLMDNHAHFVIEATEHHDISKIMQAILLSFSVKYRRKYGYEGHVWQGRFNSRPILTAEYFRGCLNYIHNNPVKAGMVDEGGKYAYSSARFYGGHDSKGVYDYFSLSRFGDTSTLT